MVRCCTVPCRAVPCPPIYRKRVDYFKITPTSKALIYGFIYLYCVEIIIISDLLLLLLVLIIITKTIGLVIVC